MAKCSRCGKSLGFLSTAKYCNDCQVHVQAELQSLQEAESENTRKAREQYDAQRAEIAVGQAQSLQARIENGERIILYESIYLPVDSRIVDEAMSDNFSIRALRQMGFDG